MEYQKITLPYETISGSVRWECLKLVCSWAEPDINDLETSTREIVKAAEAFEAFVKGGESDEQPPEPKKADAPKPIRAWVSRDKRANYGFDIYTLRPPVKEVCGDGTEMYVSGDGGELFGGCDDVELLGFDLYLGEVVEVEITVRKV